MRKFHLLTLLVLGLMLMAGCGLLPASNPPSPPQPTATDSPYKATPLSELPPTWTPAPTFTPTITFTPSPTTPPPTATPNWNNFDIQAMMTPVTVSISSQNPGTEGWQTIAGSTFRMKIPPDYQVIDLGEGFGELMSAFFSAFMEGFSEFAAEMGAELSETAVPTQESPELAEFPEFDFQIAIDSSGLSAFIISGSEYTEGITTEELINQSLTNFDGEFLLLSREVITDTEYQIERVVIEIDDPDLGIGNQAIYAVLGDQNAWTVIYAAPLEQYETEQFAAEAAVLSLSPLQ